MKRAASPLTAGLIAKGAAVPSPAVASGHVGAVPGDGDADTSSLSTASAYHKALTVRLDASRYKALKRAGVEHDLSAQDIFIQALDAWLASHPLGATE